MAQTGIVWLDTLVTILGFAYLAATAVASASPKGSKVNSIASTIALDLRAFKKNDQ